VVKLTGQIEKILEAIRFLAGMAIYIH